MKRSRHRRVGIVIVLIALGGIGFGWLVFRSREPELLKRAKRVAILPQYGVYRWLSNHELLITDYKSAHYDRLDLSTGRKQAVPILNRLIHEGHHTDLQVSPDGKWVLWNGGEEQSVNLAISLDGKHHDSYDGFWDDNAMGWLADSRHWIQFTNREEDPQGSGENGLTHVTIHDIRTPDVSTEYTIPASYHVWGRHVTSSNHLLQSSYFNPEEVSQNVRIDEFELLPRIRPLRSFNARLPFRAGVDEVEPSPAGDRIVWHCIRTIPTSPLLAWLHRFVPGIKAPRRTVESLWVSRLDGRELRELGYRTEPPSASVDSERDDVEELAWLPDGKHLSFVYKDVLYAVPAD